MPPDVIAFGEIGLAGEVRSVQMAEQRVSECARLGFRRIALPSYSKNKVGERDAELVPLKSVFDAVRLLKDAKGSSEEGSE